MRFWARAALIFLWVFSLSSRGISAGPIPVNQVPAKSPIIVIGFLGGTVSHTSPGHLEVQLASRLRGEYTSGVDVETYENYHGRRALHEVLNLLDANHRGNPTADEKHAARIIIYGHSWGALEVLTFARSLHKAGIPVLLTIQVDSVWKPGRNDKLVPSNVAQAINFYQRDDFIRGVRVIHAADPERTELLGDYQYDYAKSKLKCEGYAWYAFLPVRSHVRIECDPVVWNRVGDMIRDRLPGTEAADTARSEPLPFEATVIGGSYESEPLMKSAPLMKSTSYRLVRGFSEQAKALTGQAQHQAQANQASPTGAARP